MTEKPFRFDKASLLINDWTINSTGWALNEVKRISCSFNWPRKSKFNLQPSWEWKFVCLSFFRRYYSTSCTPRRGLTKLSRASAEAFKKKSRDWQLWWIGQCWAAQHNAALRKSNCEFSLQFTRVAVTIDSTKGCAGIFKWFALALCLPTRQLECFTLRESVWKIYMSLGFIPADESPAMCIMHLLTLICNWPAAGLQSCAGKNLFTFGSNVAEKTGNYQMHKRSLVVDERWIWKAWVAMMFVNYTRYDSDIKQTCTFQSFRWEFLKFSELAKNDKNSELLEC